MKKQNLETMVANVNAAIVASNRSSYLVAFRTRELWEAFAAGIFEGTFSSIAGERLQFETKQAADKAALQGLFIDYDSKARKAEIAGDFDRFSLTALEVLGQRAEARKAYAAGGLTAARRAAMDFMKKYNLVNGARRDDIAKAGKPAKADNTKARGQVAEADKAEAARIAAKEEAAAKEARAKAARALTARKADFDAAMSILRAAHTGNKKDFDRLVRAARAAAFGNDDYEKSEYIAARKAEADKAAAEAEKRAEAEAAAKAEKRAAKAGGLSNVRVTTEAAEAEAAKAGGHSVPHVPKPDDGAAAKAVKAAMEADKAAAAK